MLDIKQVHLLIEQGLNSLGLFNEQAFLHQQVDLSINHVVEKHINDLQNKTESEYTATERAILRFLNRREHIPIVVSDDRYYEAPIPIGFEELSTSYTVFGLCNCKGNNCFQVLDNTRCLDCSGEPDNKIIPGAYYVAQSLTKYNNVTYKENQIFRGITNVTTAVGEYFRLPTKEKDNIEVSIGLLDQYSVSSLVKNSFKPLLAWDENKFYIYYNPIVRDKEIPLELVVNYTRAFDDSLKASWCDGQTLGFPSGIQRYYIDLVIAYLAVINKQDQQNIVNLKAETI